MVEETTTKIVTRPTIISCANLNKLSHVIVGKILKKGLSHWSLDDDGFR